MFLAPPRTQSDRDKSWIALAANIAIFLLKRRFRDKTHARREFCFINFYCTFKKSFSSTTANKSIF